MAKTSFVLRALKIIGLEEILKLSEVLKIKQTPLKKAAGEELIVWDDAKEMPPKKSQPTEERLIKDAKILDFPKPKKEEEPPKAPEEEGSLITSEIVLWQREMSKQAGENAHKKDAVKGYKKSNDMYVVKTPNADGKEEVRFASTNGVLVNKKQA